MNIFWGCILQPDLAFPRHKMEKISYIQLIHFNIYLFFIYKDLLI